MSEYEINDRVVITDGKGENFVGRVKSISDDSGRLRITNNDGTYYWKDPSDISGNIRAFRNP